MPVITEEEIKKLAELSRVHLEDAELRAAHDINAILENFENIQSIDTTDVLPADDVTGLKNVAREDVANDHVLARPDDLLKNAKMTHGYVEVSAVFSDNGVS